MSCQVNSLTASRELTWQESVTALHPGPDMDPKPGPVLVSSPQRWRSSSQF